ncbi:hypothetical protein ABKN59_011061 [Abortiporus biennis]
MSMLTRIDVQRCAFQLPSPSRHLKQASESPGWAFAEVRLSIAGDSLVYTCTRLLYIWAVSEAHKQYCAHPRLWHP